MNDHLNFRRGRLLAVGLGAGLLLSGVSELLFVPQARAQKQATSKQNDVGAVQGSAQTLNGRWPDQAHVMADVGHHFANLWFAAGQQNWPLAKYCLDQTRSHLKWAVRIQPVRKTRAGRDVDLNGILEAVDNTMLAEIGKAIESKDTARFETEYRQTLVGCYACHTACEKPFLRLQVPGAPGAPIINFSAPLEAADASAQAGDAIRGKVLFRQNCALCHGVGQGPGNVVISGQGPNLMGIVGRRAGSGANFNYSKALGESRLNWDSPTLDRFLANPMAAVPGTSMLVSIPAPGNRRDLIAYLATLTAPAGLSQTANPGPAAPSGPDAGDWHNDAPEVKHHVELAALPAPYATTSAGNGPRVVQRPADAALSVPSNFTVRLFADGLSGPRLLRVAPNGDIFIAETRANRIRVLRAADGADAPSQNEVFADGLDRPFGIAFYPSGLDPQWIYVANNNAVVRFAYRNGDLKARGDRSRHRAEAD